MALLSKIFFDSINMRVQSGMLVIQKYLVDENEVLSKGLSLADIYSDSKLLGSISNLNSINELIVWLNNELCEMHKVKILIRKTIKGLKHTPQEFKNFIALNDALTDENISIIFSLINSLNKYSERSKNSVSFQLQSFHHALKNTLKAMQRSSALITHVIDNERYRTSTINYTLKNFFRCIIHSLNTYKSTININEGIYNNAVRNQENLKIIKECEKLIITIHSESINLLGKIDKKSNVPSSVKVGNPDNELIDDRFLSVPESLRGSAPIFYYFNLNVIDNLLGNDDINIDDLDELLSLSMKNITNLLSLSIITKEELQKILDYFVNNNIVPYTVDGVRFDIIMERIKKNLY